MSLVLIIASGASRMPSLKPMVKAVSSLASLAVIELLEGLLLRLRQHLHQIILVARQQVRQMRVSAAFNDIPIARSDVAVV